MSARLYFQLTLGLCVLALFFVFINFTPLLKGVADGLEGDSLDYYNPPPSEHNPKVIFEQWFTENRAPIQSLCVTMHDREETGVAVLQKAISLAVETFEIIVVLDGCVDRTEEVLLKEVQHLAVLNEGFLHLLIMSVNHSIFETSANNLSLRAAKGQFSVIIQDDMFMTTPGYNLLLVEPLRQFDDVFGVSGRCAHHLYSTQHTGNVGRCGGDIDRPLEMGKKERCTLFIRDTVNRGPLVYRSDWLRDLDYLDEENFVLGDDEHDLHARAYFKYGWKVGIRPIDFDAPLRLGATRKPRSQEETDYLVRRQSKSNGGFLRRLKERKDEIPLHDEDRLLAGCSF